LNITIGPGPQIEKSSKTKKISLQNFWKGQRVKVS